MWSTIGLLIIKFWGKSKVIYEFFVQGIGAPIPMCLKVNCTYNGSKHKFVKILCVYYYQKQTNKNKKNPQLEEWQRNNHHNEK